MKAYYGTKLVLAEPVPANEHHAEDGYRVRYSDGYESWPPRQAFEEAYQPMNALSFGHAIRVLKDGKRSRAPGGTARECGSPYKFPTSIAR